MSHYAVETNELTKRFGDVLAVDCVNLRVKAGDLYGLLGFNGAGKAATIRALLGMEIGSPGLSWGCSAPPPDRARNFSKSISMFLLSSQV